MRRSPEGELQVSPDSDSAFGSPRRQPHCLRAPEAPNEDICYIPLTRGLHAIVDAADCEWLSRYKWYATRPSPSGRVYAARGNRGAKIWMHRMIMRPPKGMVVDHSNGNRRG